MIQSLRATPGEGTGAVRPLPALALPTQRLVLGVWLLALSVFFAAMAAANLADYYPVTADDAWILSASHKLAARGVFGSDLYADFFNAEQHYYIALPGQHVLQAIAFRVFGSGIVQARWVSVMSALVVVGAVGTLAWRRYGLWAAVLATLLLVFWRSGLLATADVPLVRVSRTARYDVTAVAWMWLTLLCLDATLRRPAGVRALATGACAGAAALTQFFGAFILPVVIVAWAWHEGKRALGSPVSRWMAGGLAILVGPYALYVAAHWQDAVGQTRYIKGERAVVNAGVVLDNLAHEAARFRSAVDQPGAGAGPWLLVLTILPALVYLGTRLWRGGTWGDRMLALYLGGVGILLATGDTTKAPLYALPLLPAICLIVAAFLVRALDGRGISSPPLRWAVRAVVVGVVGLVVAQGAQFYRQDRRAAAAASSYEDLGARMRQALPAGARAAGAERWWWALRDRPYLAANCLWLQWEVEQPGGPPLSSFVQGANVQYLIVNDNVRGDISHRSRELQTQFWSFVERCTRQTDGWHDPGYGVITLHAVQAGCK